MIRSKVIQAIVALVMICALVLTACTQQASPAPTQAPAPKPTMQPTVWHLQTVLSPTYAVTQNWMWMAEEVKKQTNGLLTIEVHPSAGLSIPVNKVLSSTRDGVCEMGEIASSLHVSDFPYISITGLPGFVPWDSKLRSQLENNVVAPLYQKELEEKWKQISLGTLLIDPNLEMFTKKPLLKLSDLAGQKMRVVDSTAGFVISSLGASPVTVTTAAVYSAVQSGVVDGYLGTSGFFLGNKLYELIKYAYMAHLGGTTFLLTANMDAWNKLTPDVQKIVMEVAEEAEAKSNATLTPAGTAPSAYEKEMVQHGVTVTYPSPEDAAKLKQIGDQVVEDFVKKYGPLTKEMVDKVKAFVASYKG